MVDHRNFDELQHQVNEAVGELNIHALLVSRVNGPGTRAVIWFQGCPLRCPGCFNPETHDTTPRQLMTPQQLWEWVNTIPEHIEGVTITGGEPLLQAKPLAAFLHLLRRNSELSVILYSGYTLEQIQRLPFGKEILSLVDVLIDGRFEHDKPANDGIRGSTNQRIHFLTKRYSFSDLRPRRRCEFVITPDGMVIQTGVSVMPPPAPSVPLPSESPS